MSILGYQYCEHLAAGAILCNGLIWYPPDVWVPQLQKLLLCCCPVTPGIAVLNRSRASMQLAQAHQVTWATRPSSVMLLFLASALDLCQC